MSYTFDFGDGSYVLTTCSEATHVYTRVGYFHVKASARTNVSGPIMGSTWVLIQSSTGKMTLDYPQGTVEAGNETEIVVSISQGTWMEATFVTPTAKRKSRKFNISGKTGCKWQGIQVLYAFEWHILAKFSRHWQYTRYNTRNEAHFCGRDYVIKMEVGRDN